MSRNAMCAVVTFLALLFSNCGLVNAQSTSHSPSEQEAQLHFKVAQIALKNSDFSVALDELRKAADLAPGNSLVQYDLAVVLKQQGMAQEGLEHLQEAMKLGLPVKEKASAQNLLAELTYALKSQPLYDLNYVQNSASSQAAL